jgi:sporulation protein YlmC with PRC-barrel domain
MFQAMQATGQERAVPVQERPQTEAADPSNFYRATDVIGMVIRDEEGEATGKVSDIVIDGTTEQVQYLLVEGVESIAEGHVLILPWSVVEVHYADVPDQRFVVVHINRSRLLKAPTFARDSFHVHRGGDWIVRVNAYFETDGRDSRRRSARPDFNKNRRQRDGQKDRDSRRPSQTPERDRDGAEKGKPQPKQGDQPSPQPKSGESSEQPQPQEEKPAPAPEQPQEKADDQPAENP